MPSSDRRVAGALVACAIACAWPRSAGAQQQAEGFAVDRLYSSPAGAGWIVMDDLSMQGGIGGAISVSGGYARNPLHVGDGAERKNVVADHAAMRVAMAVTYDRFRLHLDFAAPIAVKGQSGVVGNRTFVGPTLDLARSPDTLADARIGFDVRIFGEAKSAVRLGAGVLMFVPSGEREDYVTDGRYRGMGRFLLAADVGRFAIAANAGVHLRTLNDADTPGSPRGSELVFGVAAGPRFVLAPDTKVIVGPEIFGESALRAFFGKTTTGLEALLTGRLERGNDASQLRFKLGIGAGIHPEFGAPAWRAIFAIEITDHLK